MFLTPDVALLEKFLEHGDALVPLPLVGVSAEHGPPDQKAHALVHRWMSVSRPDVGNFPAKELKDWSDNI